VKAGGAVWLVSLRDLQLRKRRFAIVVLATGLVFAIALILSGVSSSFTSEVDRTVAAFGADRWVVPEGTGPFSSAKAFLADDVIAGVEGADAVSPFVMNRVSHGAKDVMVFGTEIDGVGPRATDGRDVRASGEIVLDESVGLGVGDRITLGESRFRVVGTTAGRTMFAGSPTAVISIDDARDMGFASQPLATSLLVRGVPTSVPDGFRAVTNDAAIADLGRPLKQATGTIDFLRVLLWLIAVGIIGSIVYLTVLEQTRDYAVLKATGITGGVIFGVLLVEAVVVAVAAALVAVLLSLVLGPLVPMNVEISATTYLLLPVIAALAGVVASLVGLRRAVGVDPALAFG
jgi:putative ABC transport system permease protein